MRLQYPAVLQQDEDGHYLVRFPDFTWGATDGETKEEALAEAQDCLDELIIATLEEGEDLPVPSEVTPHHVPVAPSALIAAKALLHFTVSSQQLNKSQLARQMGVDEKAVRTMMAPRKGSKVQSIESALAAMGKRIVLSIEETEQNYARAL